MEQFKKILGSGDIEKIKSYLQYMKCSYKDCLAANKMLREKIGIFSGNTKIEVALLGSYTLNNLMEPMWFSLVQKGFLPGIIMGQYNQYVQEILDENSEIRKANPDIIFILLDTETFLEGVLADFQNLPQEEVIESVDAKISYLKTVLSAVKSSMKSRVVISNLSLPFYSPLGLRDINSDYGVKKLVFGINGMISSLAKEFDNVTVFDFDSFASYYGKKNITDDKYWHIGRIYISNEFAAQLCSQLSQIAASYYGKAKKCLVVDLDNTLWGGVIGEEFVDGIQLGEGPLGEAYSGIQRVMLDFHNNGVILAINSKNNMEDVEPVFSHRNMVLKKDNFAAIKCNWDDKASNFLEISKELNIGLDSMAYLDDNPIERESIKSKLPQVYVIDFPEDVTGLPGVLKTLGIFDLLKISKEDKKRTQMYLEEKKRNELKEKFSSLNDYLFDLGMVLEVEKLNDGNIDRITQLINKTNQFNLRTKRYSKEEVLHFMNSRGFKVYAASLKDKFGDFGIMGVIILENKKDCWFIDAFLLSCRAMSRGVEKEFLRQALHLYRELGFSYDNGYWWLDLRKKQMENVKWIKVVLDAYN
ncbi:HAD family hydrolase [Candidatus Woesearchaeota archaeon]|nr:HAD family hydrolase [Candidatus Woesearchaeota archaeon]